MSKFIDERVAEIEASSFADIVQSNGPDVKNLLDRVCTTFEQYDMGTQGVVLSLLYGMLLAACEGQICDAEKSEGIIITSEDRIKLFLATVRVTYREACEAATMAPTTTTRH